MKYSPEKYYLEADCLSRNPVVESNENMENQVKIDNLIKLEGLKKSRKERICSKEEKQTDCERKCLL